MVAACRRSELWTGYLKTRGAKRWSLDGVTRKTGKKRAVFLIVHFHVQEKKRDQFAFLSHPTVFKPSQKGETIKGYTWTS